MKPILGAGYDSLRGDALLFPEDLESLDKTFYEELLNTLIARRVFALKNDDNPGAETLTYEMVTLVGDMDKAVFNWHAGADLALADSDIDRNAARVISLSLGFTISEQELRAARMIGRPIETLKARSAAWLIARKENDLAFNGDSVLGIQGAFNVTGGQDVAGLTGGWSAATNGVTIYEDIRLLRAAIAQHDGLEPRALVLNPIHRENLAKPMSASNPFKTVIAQIRENGWFNNGASIFYSSEIASTKALCLDNSPRVMQLAVPLDAQRLDFDGKPYLRDQNGRMRFVYEERTAGVIFRYPLGVARVTSGI